MLQYGNFQVNIFQYSVPLSTPDLCSLSYKSPIIFAPFISRLCGDASRALICQLFSNWEPHCVFGEWSWTKQAVYPTTNPTKPPLTGVALALSTNIKTSFQPPHVIDKLSRKPHNKEQLLKKIQFQVFDPFPISSPCLTKWGFRCEKYS